MYTKIFIGNSCKSQKYVYQHKIDKKKIGLYSCGTVEDSEKNWSSDCDESYGHKLSVSKATTMPNQKHYTPYDSIYTNFKKARVNYIVWGCITTKQN